MSFNKKIVVLKETHQGYALSGKKISGIARIEIESGVAELHLSVINACAVSSGEFFFIITDSDNAVFSFPLGKRPFAFNKPFLSVPNIENGLCAGLCHINEDLPVTIAFACSDGFSIGLTEFKKIVADKCLEDRKKRIKENALANTENDCSTCCEHPAEQVQNIEENLSTTNPYDDEAVATENYYALSDEICDKICLIKECDHAFLRNKNGLPYEQCQTQAQESQNTTYRVQNETNDCSCKKSKEREPYFHTVKEELSKLFSEFTPEESLCALFADSNFVKINYSGNKYYVVGLIKENGKEKYICYGVPAKYSENPPEQLKDCACFIPLSVFDLKGNGYWMMFQDAITGSCIKLVKNNALT